MRDNPCNIGICATRDRDRAIRYISAKFMKRYGTSPPSSEIPPTLFIAKEGIEIVGALALNFASEGTLPHERLFAFDQNSIPIKDYDRERTAYYSRWSSSREMVGKALWLAASWHALKRGASYSASTGKAFIYQYFCDQFDCPWHPIQDAVLIRSAVARSDHNYFFTDPCPKPHIGIIDRQIRTLPSILAPALETRRIVIEIPES